jgi:hypothetical protein
MYSDKTRQTMCALTTAGACVRKWTSGARGRMESDYTGEEIMANQEKIRADIRALLPGAEDFLVESLVAKVEEELHDICLLRKVGRRRRKGTVERVIHNEELAALGLR